MRKSFVERTPSLEILEQALIIRHEIAKMEERLVALLTGYRDDENVVVRRSSRGSYPRTPKFKRNQSAKLRRYWSDVRSGKRER